MKHLKPEDKTIVKSLLKQLKAKSEDEYEHAKRVKSICQKLAQALDLKKADVDLVLLAASLHDVGKLALGDEVLEKQSRLTVDEYRDVQDHVAQADQFLENLSIKDQLIPLIRHHHENVNGFGYPDGLKGDKIPLGARLIHIAEAYDAMTSRGRHPAQALGELKTYAGRIYDDTLVKVFEEKVWPILSQTGESGS